MFSENNSHLQQNLFSTRNLLSEKKQKKLQSTPEAHFYDLVFTQIDEKTFAPLYSDTGSRPNAPVNALISAIILYNHRGWSTQDLFDRIDFDLRVRTALGLHDFEQTPFCSATFFNFQNRLLSYWAETGINLIESVFDSLTKQQLKQLKLKTNIQRMDSFQALSNIRHYGRIQLLVEVLIRLFRSLTDEQKELLKSQFDSYVQNKSTTFVYDLKKSDIPYTLEELGKAYHAIYLHLKSETLCDTDTFAIFERVYREHFCIDTDTVLVRDAKELDSSMLQSPDDIDATYRRKRGKDFQGHVVNVAETAHPDNAVNLITDVAVEANNVDDSTILTDRIDGLKEKHSDLNEIHTDGGYGSSDSDEKMQEHNINHVQTATRGRTAAVAMEIEPDEAEGYCVTCPCQKARAEKTKKRFKACFDIMVCSDCIHKEECPAVEQKSHRAYYFYEDMARQQQRARAIESLPKERQKLRPNVEATMKEYTKAFNHKGKLKIRGRFKTMLFAIAMSMGINFGRIYRNKQKNPDPFMLFWADLYRLYTTVSVEISDFVKNGFNLLNNQRISDKIAYLSSLAKWAF